MEQFTSQGEQAIRDLAYRYGLSQDAVTTMLYAVQRGNGTMAQFSHPELGGMGQWMQGGMTMVGDMFNQSLKFTVDSLCNDLARLLQQGNVWQPAPAPTFSNNTYNSGSWWPAELGYPSSSGAQNDTAYAFFPAQQRLAIKQNGVVTLYNTLNHQIGGVSQQQGGMDSMTFTSQYGTVRLSDLPVVNVIR